MMDRILNRLTKTDRSGALVGYAVFFVGFPVVIAILVAGNWVYVRIAPLIGP